MAKNTKYNLRNLFIYQVFNRNHNESGTFNEFVEDLDRIKDLGVDVVYLLPIHEIGEINRKGDLGCPYSIKDYNSINPEYGTLEDFKNLIDEVHNRGMKLMMDIVYNHTSHDSVLLKNHPEWFMRKDDGELTLKVPDWSDITDFDFASSKELWDNLIESLIYYVKMGVDGFRCDVASLVPLEFWLKAREEVAKVNPDVFWLTESVHGHFLKELRDQGHDIASECELYQAFDMAYDYDTQPLLEGYLNKQNTFKEYVKSIELQEQIYPKNYIKLRNLENHDFGRFAPMVDGNIDKINNFLAATFFLKGAKMIYAGQEFCDMNKPDLFTRDLVNYDGHNFSDLIKKLAELNQGKIYTEGAFNIKYPKVDEVFYFTYSYEGKNVSCIFNVGLNEGTIEVNIEDGTYINLINDESIKIENKSLTLTNKPVVLMH